uniref:Exocyst complex component Sec8 n=3 Tax=Clastoptera arizonana TaxID=38151 RepID=A0A1B6EHB1_9HEMI
MTSVPVPTKPPRGVKNPKETSGLLMSVIRTLSASESNEQRDKEKAKLEKEYQKSDQQLDELVSQHHEDLTHVMQAFAKLSVFVNTSREKIHTVKENLQACKALLSCRRDELKKLWLEGIEYKHTLELLEKINQLKEVPLELSNHLNNRHYLHATELLVSSLKLGSTSLKEVEALKDLRSELDLKKQQLHISLMEELTKHIYVTYLDAGQEMVTSRLIRQGSYRENTPNSVDRSRREHTPSIGFSKRENVRKHLDFTNGPRSDKLSNDKVEEDLTATNPELDSHNFVAILIECLGLLKKLPEAVEKLKIEMQVELLKLVERTSRQLVPSDTSHPLVDLLTMLIEQFRLITSAHKLVLSQLSKAAQSHKVHINVYDLSDVWCRIQAVMQLLLTDYLDIQNTTTETQTSPTTFTEQSSNISSFFSRRRQPTRSRKGALFKFEYSSHALTMNNLVKNQDSGLKGVGDSVHREKLLVCQPDPQNITLIFTALTRFIEEIEDSMNCQPGNPCTLNAFISDYVRDIFITRQHSVIASKVDSATKYSDAWKMAISPEVAAELGLPRPLLQSTVTVDQCMQDVHRLMEALPSHAGNLLNVNVSVIHSYRETCLAAYRGIVQPHPEDKRVCSAAWLNDDDISRFLKSLPNWTDLKAQKSMIGIRKSLKREDTVEEESPEDVRQRNIKEAEILASNLAEGGIGSHEIISDAGQLKCLALLQESMEWFSKSIYHFTSQLQRSQTPNQRTPKTHNNVPTISVLNVDGIPALPEGSVISLENLAHEFEELANTCLLVLHLEVRVQCFYYLLPRGTGDRFVNNSPEPDPKVLDLSRVLSAIDEAMAASLQPRKSKYIFEGLGHLVAKILMSSSQYLDRIDEATISKMCRNILILQQTLTNITLAREVALDHARHYFQLFYLTPEEILSRVLEKGPEFTELEYMNAFQLINRSQTQLTDPSIIQRHLQRLSDILGEVGVTV